MIIELGLASEVTIGSGPDIPELTNDGVRVCFTLTLFGVVPGNCPAP